MKYSSLLYFHIHELVIQASNIKQDCGSAEYIFWGSCWTTAILYYVCIVI